MRSRIFEVTLRRLVVAASVLALGACVHIAAGRQPTTQAATGATPAPAPKPGDGVAGNPEAAPKATLNPGALVTEPPDGKWLVDEQGRQYFLMSMTNDAATYEWVGTDKKQLRTAYGLTFDVADYDDKTIHLKLYRVEPTPSPARHSRPPEEIAAEYASATPSADRLIFRSFADGLPTAGQWREGFSVKDVNGDSQLDIVHGPARKGNFRPQLFLGDGAGHWRPWSTVSFPSIPFDYGDADSADLNGDGKADLVLASHLRGITAMIGDGNGHFTPWTTGIEFAAKGDPTTGALAFSSRAIKIADWNGDGRLDVVALSEGPSLLGGREFKVAPNPHGLVVYLNNGDGTWQKTTGGENARNFFGDALEVADIDGDGRLDVLVSSGVQGFKRLVQRGLPDGGWEAVLVEPIRDKAVVGGVAAGDVDHDGKTDLIIGYQSFEGGVWRTGVDVLYAVPSGGWRRVALASEESMAGIFGLALGDLDGDGASDLVALTGEGAGWVFLGDGKGGFVREQGDELSSPACRGTHVELVDLDHDGKAEVVAEFAGEAQGLLPQQKSCESGGRLQAWKAFPRPR